LNHKETEIQTPSNLVGGLWTQLVLGRPIPPAVCALYDHHKERRTRPPLADFFRALNSAVAQYPKVYLVIDALDEYPEDKRHKFLQNLGTLGSHVNILITSRPHINLDSIFLGLKIIDIHATEDDINKYLEGQFGTSPRLSRHIRTRPELQDEIQLKIIANSKGM
jgi:hypothetical protein